MEDGSVVDVGFRGFMKSSGAGLMLVASARGLSIAQ